MRNSAKAALMQALIQAGRTTGLHAALRRHDRSTITSRTATARINGKAVHIQGAERDPDDRRRHNPPLPCSAFPGQPHKDRPQAERRRIPVVSSCSAGAQNGT